MLLKPAKKSVQVCPFTVVWNFCCHNYSCSVCKLVATFKLNPSYTPAPRKEIIMGGQESILIKHLALQQGIPVATIGNCGNQCGQLLPEMARL